jgi:hypothetical protein
VSIVARVFVVLNLILSVLFLVASMQIWTARTKWQKMYEYERGENIKLKVAAQAKEQELARAVVQRDEVLKARKADVAKLKTDVNGLRDELLQVRGELGEAKAQAQMQMALNEELVREVNRRSEQLDKAKNVVLKQQQALEVVRGNEGKARNERAEMENELNTLRQQHAQVMRDKNAVEEELALQTRRIMNAIEKGVPAEFFVGADVEATQKPLPPAKVLGVKPELNLVILSIGSNVGARPGYRMTISRGEQYIAKAEIVKVYPDMCSARLLPDLKKGEVQIHDDATSRVPGIR